jgi:predicted phage terminase large subunit-like protein
MLWFSLRLDRALDGDIDTFYPRAFVSTTPKPTELIKDLVLGRRTGASAKRIPDPAVVVTKGTPFDNEANLPGVWFRDTISRYEGTTLGRQEIYAEILEDVEGALWNVKMLDALRVNEAPELVKVVVGVDPPGGKTECGIVVAGVGEDGHGYVIEDRSLRASPDKWAKEAILAYNRHGANKIIGESNYGGDMVENTIKMAARDFGIAVPYEAVVATRGKRIRAEPVAALYEQGRVHHVGKFDALEGEMTTWTPDDKESPNRMDALVWAMTKLMVGFMRAKGDLGIS